MAADEHAAVTYAEASGTVTNRLLWEILEELRRPNRESALRAALRLIADESEVDSYIEEIALRALRGC